MSIVYVALGSNLGDRADNLRYARQLLGELPGTQLTGCSHVYETAPVGPIDQRPFLNAAVELNTSLAPIELLDHLQAIEDRCGRVRKERWGPRTIDLDMLLYDDLQMNKDRLILPHPYMHERAFVLKPLADVAPELRLNRFGRTVQELLAAVGEQGVERVVIANW